MTNPLPSLGGGMMHYALKNIECDNLPERNSKEHLNMLHNALKKGSIEWANMLVNNKKQINKISILQLFRKYFSKKIRMLFS